LKASYKLLIEETIIFTTNIATWAPISTNTCW